MSHTTRKNRRMKVADNSTPPSERLPSADYDKDVERTGPAVEQDPNWGKDAEPPEPELPASKPERVERQDAALEVKITSAAGEGATVGEAFRNAMANAKGVSVRMGNEALKGIATPAYVPPQVEREKMADFDPVDVARAEKALAKKPEIEDAEIVPDYGAWEGKPTTSEDAAIVPPSDHYIRRAPITLAPPMAAAIAAVPKVVAVEERVARRHIPPSLIKPLEGAQEVPVGDLLPSTINPRKVIGDVKELADSIRSLGRVQTPILARPAAGGLELVYGQRRLAAAIAAGFKTIPCIVRELTDDQALEEALVENGQRKDIAPLEEAEAFHQLHTRFGRSVDEIAAKVGKSKRWIYTRLQLQQLGPEGRAALEGEKMNASVALLVARIPSHKLQAEALQKILGDEERGVDPLSYREAEDLVQSEYTTELRGAPFDTKDDMLVEGVGACGPCPYRTGNNPDLFADVKRADVCTNTPCFKSKCEATWEARRTAAESKGKKILPPSEGRKLYKFGQPTWNSPWVELDAPAPEDKKKRTWRELLFDSPKVKAETAPAIHVTVDQKWKTHELVRRDAALAALDKAGIRWAAPELEREEKRKPETEEDKARRDLEDKAQQLVRTTIVAKAVEAVERVGAEPHVVRIMVIALLNRWHYQEVAERRGLGSVEKLQAWAEKKATPGQLIGLLFELCAGEWTEGDDERKAVVKVFKIDLPAIEKAARAGLEADALFDRKRAGGEAQPGTCSKCGCTEDQACPEGCAWANAEQTLCTACGGDVETEKPKRKKRKAA